jgi:hypothetical protein
MNRKDRRAARSKQRKREVGMVIRTTIIGAFDEHHEHEAARTERLAGLDTLTLAQRVHRREPTRAELVSIRRALAVLAHAGEARWRGRQHRHPLRPPATGIIGATSAPP